MQPLSSIIVSGLRVLSLRQRLGLGMAILVLPLLLISASGYLLFQFAIESMEESHEEIRDEMLPILRLQELILQAQMPGNDYLILGDSDERDKFERMSADVAAGFEKALAAPFGMNEKRDILVRALDLWREGERMSRKILALPDPVGNAAGAELMIRMDATLQSASDHLRAVSVLGLAELDRQHAIVHKLNLRVSVAIGVFLVILSLMVFLGSILVRQWIISPLSELEKAAQQFTAGHLEHRIPLQSNDEIGSVSRTFNEMASALKRDRDILRNLSIHDQLTGLLNRKEFQRLLDLEIARSQRHGRVLALLMIDVDFFKSVNDRYGHPAGDIVLRSVADRLFTALRPNDVVARYGGEEFIVMLPETDGAGAVTIAERLCTHVRGTPMDIAQGIQPVVTVSAGIAVYPADADAAEALIAAADQALYAAKGAGRDRCCRYAGLSG
jgi:diguanylate cyclase (GGDEF)-like protein